jgi:hypothetical protein
MKPVLLFLALLVSISAGAENRAAAGQTRTAQIGGVSVSVTPLNLAERDAATTDFKIVMDTHSDALPSNMLASAVLIGQAGKESQPLTWSGGRGGHHLSGKLSFPATGREEGGIITLVLKKVDGRGDERFEWKTPWKSANNIEGGVR